MDRWGGGQETYGVVELDFGEVDEVEEVGELEGS
jgi:hypothetical protein